MTTRISNYKSARSSVASERQCGSQYHDQYDIHDKMAKGIFKHLAT